MSSIHLITTIEMTAPCRQKKNKMPLPMLVTDALYNHNAIK